MCLPEISIHAPPRGATTASRVQSTNQSISIHAPPRGATRAVHLPKPARQHGFQFTPLREGRRRVQLSGRAEGHFNSRPSARGDRTSAAGVSPRGGFQFTPLREGRRCMCSASPKSRYFNSRPSARGDGKRYAISANLLFNPYKSAWLNNSATQFVEIILVIFHRIIA